MHLYEVPLVFALIGLAMYAVLAGADFGAGAWQLTAGKGPHAERIRDQAHAAIGPVWEANHVWLIFVLTVVWTAYPGAFGSIASTLSVPLFIAALGIIFRGAAYALRGGTSTPRELRAIDTVSGLSSILTPFALGAAVGGIASGRVPVGNAAGHMFSSWLNATSILTGLMAVATSWYLAAVDLAADSVRLGDRELEQAFRARALGAGLAAGAVVIAALPVTHSDAHALYDDVVNGPGLVAVLVSVLAGLSTLALVWRRRYEPARYTAALAVAAVIAGWAIAQNPTFLPGLTIEQAAAPHDTLVAIIVAVLAGAALLFPSLGLLFRLLLAGRFDPSATAPPAAPRKTLISASATGLAARVAGALLLGGVGFLTLAHAGWAHAIGIACLLGFVVVGFVAVAPARIAGVPAGEQDPP
jgi:cytochrome d ubiquinol oxidase subunit II